MHRWKWRLEWHLRRCHHLGAPLGLLLPLLQLLLHQAHWDGCITTITTTTTPSTTKSIPNCILIQVCNTHYLWIDVHGTSAECNAHTILKRVTPLPLLHSFPPWMTLIGQTLMCSQVHTALCISSYLRCQWWRCADYHWRVTDGSRQTDRRRIKGRKGVLSYLVSPEIVNHFLRGGWWFLLSNTMYWIALRKKYFVLQALPWLGHHVCGRWRKGCFWFSLSPTM